jgi:CheY-like chemotaxis protein
MWCLLSEGFWVDPVANGFDAAVALEAPEPPDLAVIDLGLQGFDGRRLIEGMRASDRLRQVPIIATGFTAPYAPLPPGVAFLRKPIDLPRLLLAVRELGHDLRTFFPSRRAPRPAPVAEQPLLRRTAKRDG